MQQSIVVSLGTTKLPKVDVLARPNQMQVSNKGKSLVVGIDIPKRRTIE